MKASFAGDHVMYNPMCRALRRYLVTSIKDDAYSTTSLDDSDKRVIRLNEPQVQKYCNNHISTSKYSVLGFLPSFLVEQFRQNSIRFFLLIAMLQQIPNVSPTGRYTTLLPLILILAVSLIKKIVEEIKRYRADNEINHRSTEVLRDGQWHTIKWHDLAVGDIVKVVNNTIFPADLVLLSSSEPQGMSFIETSNLDGETNLKIRQGVPSTIKILEAKGFNQFRGTLESELPNRHLYEFNGVLKEHDKQAVGLGPDQLLLRGAMLRNTAWIFGVVIYTGNDTKLMQNSTSAPLKRSTVDRLTNTLILMLFFILIILCIVSCIFNQIWTNEHFKKDWYLGIGNLLNKSFALNLITFIILYNNVIPISLQVTLELVRFLQAIFINMDIEMYHKESDTPAIARTSNLNEELGMVKHVFTDKTGTLTRNVMEFKKCSVAGAIYMVEETPAQSRLVQNILNNHRTAPALREFLTLMAICHTVIPEKQPEDSMDDIKYHATSPDERALVNGAKKFGYVFSTRTPTYVEIEALGMQERFEILNVLEFTSTRKRMSVIVRNSKNEIKLYCKGADTVICERLAPDGVAYRESTLSHLKEFATEGLRTLCCAVSDIPDDVYEDWKHAYQKASTSLQYRAEKLEDVANLIETNLRLLGATGIEDELQDGVPETIASLLEAKINVWMLTGDKQETAINIGYSCQLLSHSMDLILLNEDCVDNTRSCILEYVDNGLYDNMDRKDVALIVDGKTLQYAFSYDLRRDFLDLCLSCNVVICCGVSPLQKAEIVQLVTNNTESVTLAIGDGANDVAMIQKANVGIGISGVEGFQAASESDYSIAQFSYLRKLLFVHGTWNYSRMCKIIPYSFYKNICLHGMTLWFSIYSGWSGQLLFEGWTVGLYNTIFTVMPIFAMGLFDKETSAEQMLKEPKLYASLRNVKLLNVKVFWSCVVNALWHSIILFWLSYKICEKDVIWKNGQDGGYLVLGNMLYTYVVVTVCLKAGLLTKSWTWLAHCSIWGSIVLWFVFIFIYSNIWPVIPMGAAFTGMNGMVFTTLVFWGGLLLIPFSALLVDITCVLFRNSRKDTILTPPMRESKPSLIQNSVRFLRRARKLFTGRSPMTRNIEFELKLTILHIPDGYAFSQEEGGSVTQTYVIRAYDTNLPKPEGN